MEGLKMTYPPQVDALYECCNTFYEEKGENASSVCCPKYNLLKYYLQAPLLDAQLTVDRLKMKQRSQGST